MNQIKNIAEMYNSGLSLRKISRIVGIPRESLRLKLISSGLKLRKSKRYMVRFLHEPDFRISPISAELLALHAGDGCLDRTGEWSFTSNMNDQEHVRNIMEKFQQVVGIIPNQRIRNNKIEMSSKAKQTTEYFSKFFPKGKKSHIVSLPREIMNSNDSKIIKSALRGLFSTDGSFSFNKKRLTPRIEFRVKSKKLRNNFITLSRFIGFKFNSNTQKHWKGLIYTAYLERIDDVNKWMKNVGSSCDTHVQSYNRWKYLKFRGGSQDWSKAQGNIKS